MTLTGYRSSYLSRWLRDDLLDILSFVASETRFLAAQYILKQDWFQAVWLPKGAVALHAYPFAIRARGHDGFLFRLLRYPIRREGNTALFSAIVYGLGRHRWKAYEYAFCYICTFRSASLCRERRSRTLLSPHPSTSFCATLEAG